MIRPFETMLYDGAAVPVLHDHEFHLEVIRDNRNPVKVYVDIDGRTVLRFEAGSWSVRSPGPTESSWRPLAELFQRQETERRPGSVRQPNRRDPNR